MLRHGFTLIELLVVVAILAVLAVVVVTTLNPTGLLQQSRDSNRLQDMATLNSALGYSLADVPSEFLGSASTTYVSIPDPVATSSLGDQCQGLGLPALPSGWNYQCAASSTYRKTDGTGWIPVNLAQNTFGSPLPNLSIDPINQTSTGFFYTYTTNGSQYKITSFSESQKYAKIMAADGGTDPSLYEAGSNLGLLNMAHGLVGYWNFDESSGTAVYDTSGNGNTGTASGTTIVAGKVGMARSFGASDYVSVPNNINLNHAGSYTITAWVYFNTLISYQAVVIKSDWPTGPVQLQLQTNNGGCGSNSLYSYAGGGTGNPVCSAGNVLSTGTWTHIAVVQKYVGTNENVTFYVNGSPASGGIMSGQTGNASSSLSFGGNGSESLDDIRVYNRALSATEIQQLYNAER